MFERNDDGGGDGVVWKTISILDRIDDGGGDGVVGKTI